jgi:hypothetical protein
MAARHNTSSCCLSKRAINTELASGGGGRAVCKRELHHHDAEENAAGRCLCFVVPRIQPVVSHLSALSIARLLQWPPPSPS